MKKRTHSQILAFAAVAVLLATSGNTAFSGQALTVSSDQTKLLSDQTDFPKINRQPEDQGVYLGSNIVFTVKAENGDGYQWVRNGVVIEGQTNSTLTIEKATIEDVGVYTAYVYKGEEAVPTRAAALNVYMASTIGGGPITVFGTPLPGSGSQGSCPGPYAGYVVYSRPISQGWGWSPLAGNTIHTATDLNRTDTKVQYVGKYGDVGCNQTTVTIPDPTYSPKYRFAIYFPNNVPTNVYAITLDGFNP